MIFEIKSRFSGSLLFKLETENLKLCVEAAIKSGAYLGDADLGGAYLRGAYLRGAYLGGAYLGGAYLGGAYLGDADLGGAYLGGADLGGAYLGGADLGGAKIQDGIVITKAPIQVTGLAWLVTIWDQHMQIGCEFHSHSEWRGFTKDDWMRMGGKEAAAMQRDHFPSIIALCDQHRPEVAEVA